MLRIGNLRDIGRGDSARAFYRPLSRQDDRKAIYLDLRVVDGNEFGAPLSHQTIQLGMGAAETLRDDLTRALDTYYGRNAR